jgi:hypothetical protein
MARASQHGTLYLPEQRRRLELAGEIDRRATAYGMARKEWKATEADLTALRRSYALLKQSGLDASSVLTRLRELDWRPGAAAVVRGATDEDSDEVIRGLIALELGATVREASALAVLSTLTQETRKRSAALREVDGADGIRKKLERGPHERWLAELVHLMRLGRMDVVVEIRDEYESWFARLRELLENHLAGLPAARAEALRSGPCPRGDACPPL